VGADRRGPLAAFGSVALIAAILLVTSVRSQAAPWFRSTVVAGPVGEPHLWSSVTGGVDQVVLSGTVLVRKAGSSPDPTQTEAQAAATQVVASGNSQAHPTSHRSPSRPHPRFTRHDRASGTPQQPADDGADQPPADAPTTPADPPASDPISAPAHDHGRHLGWLDHQGQDPASDEPTDSADLGSDDADTDRPGNGHDHANGDGDVQGNGHAPGHAPGHWHGHGHAYGHDRQR
jgi:hypothetical protein